MLIRSLTLTLLLAIAGPSFAADNDSPIAGDMGRARPLIVIAQSTVDPVWVNLKKSLEDPANKKGVTDRNIKVYTILNMAGQLDGKDLGQQDTMALLRSLKLGAGAYPKVFLLGKDGETKLSASGDEAKSVDLKKIFDTVDALPASEKDLAPPTVAAPVAAEPTTKKGEKGEKGAKATKQAKPKKAPEMPDD